MLKQSILLSLLCSLSFSSDIGKEIQNLIKKTNENMVFVKGGSFMMGDPGYFKNEDEKEWNKRWVIGSPENRAKYPDASWSHATGKTDDDFVHKVTLSDFSINKFETTWGEFDTYTKAVGKELYRKRRIGKTEGRKPNHPALAPSWDEAKNYCSWLGEVTGEKYDLPTEAQWEYAARSRGKYVFCATDNGSCIVQEHNLANEAVNISNSIWVGGSYPANPLGIYDMSGNNEEWVNDWYDEEYYKSSLEFHPKGPKIGKNKIIRGVGSGADGYAICKRYPMRKMAKNYSFRCVLNH